ncbi:MAG: hypothetical protein IKQ92_10390 [Clostridia bacterium]|nr:hypothetical protein [Clostridia bacterium]
MQWTSVNDLRESFLSFFESKGHLRLPSFSLVVGKELSYDWCSEPLIVQIGATCGIPLNDF